MRLWPIHVISFHGFTPNIAAWVPNAWRLCRARHSHHMIRFARAFPRSEIVSALRRQLSRSHFKQLIYVEDELKRTFYAEMCREWVSS
ncbi:MAG: DUF1016 domain-containing protein [Deltaproteobacteria bacterium]|nr:MAG: DUF1016 domain-containing protein [Deltaproteobacteria bacterium]